MSHWIYVERQNSSDLMIGPYKTLDSAVHAMNNALLLDAICEEDCVDCYTTEEEPSIGEHVVRVDLNNPDHTGVGERDDDAVLTILSYTEEKVTA